MTGWVTTDVRFPEADAEWRAVIEEGHKLAAHRCEAVLIQAERDREGRQTGLTRQVLAVVARTTGEIIPVDQVPGFRWCHPGSSEQAVQAYRDYLSLAPLLEAEILVRGLASEIADLT